MQCNNDYKLIDLIKFLCAYLVIGIHTRSLQAVSVQSLVFVSLGMYIAGIEKSGKLTKILRKGKIALFAYLIKIPISLIGGGSTSARRLIFQSFSCYSA